MNTCLRGHVMPALKVMQSSPCLVQQVRWKKREPVRKMKWLPRAPSKLYRVYQPPALPEDEQNQINHLDRLYATKLYSIQDYFREAFFKPSLTAGGKTKEQIESELLEDERLLAENDAANQRTALARDARLAREHELEASDLLQKDSERQQEVAQKIVEAMATVASEMKRAPTYITRDTLDAAIEEALANPVDYDFHIDKIGKIYVDGTLHPYTLRPHDKPETSSNTAEVPLMDKQELKFKEKKLY